MRVLVSGSSGLIGSALILRLMESGHSIVRLVRSRSANGDSIVEWNPETATLEGSRLEGLDAVVHLAGENIAARWTEKKKARIRESRVMGTRLLAETLAHLARPPRVLVTASAIGFYGERGDEELSEDSPPGQGFLADVCRDWESAAKPAADKGIRVVPLRIGLVLSSAGGALPRMLRPFKLGLGGKLGAGNQYMSWITIDDVVGVMAFVLSNGTLSGPVNAVAPGAVRNKEFTETLGKVLRRPTIFTVPWFGVRMLFGEMGESLLLSSQRVKPARLQAAGFPFLYPELEPALLHLLKRDKGP